MPRLLKTLLILFITGILGLSVLCGIGVRMIKRTLPQTTGTLMLSGLHSPVTLYRDGYHVPHILADNADDLYFAQGFTAAQDRLWQMELWRRAAWGRLSEVFGASMLGQDSLARTLGFGRLAQALEETISNESKQILLAYAQGVNAFMKNRAGRLSVEFALLGLRPEPWTVADGLALTRWLAWSASQSWPLDGILTALYQKLGTEKMKSLWPQVDWKAWERSGMNRKVPAIRVKGLADQITGSGADAWALAGTRTASGLPLLTGDLHGETTLPGTWMEVHLVGGGLDCYGLTLPGLPGVVMGQNRDIAWAAGPAQADDTDLMVLDGNTPVTTLTERIALPGDSSLTLVLQTSRHGPVANALLGAAPHPPLALRWTGQDPSDDILALSRLNRAFDWTSFRAALSDLGLIPLRFVYADQEGHIGLQAAGPFYDRPGVGFLPRSTAWEKPMAFDKLESVFDPSSGAIWTAGAPGKSDPPVLWMDSRSRRLEERLNASDKFGLQETKQLQGDLFSPWAAAMAQRLLPHIDRERLQDPALGSIAEAWKNWPGDLREGNQEGAVFQVALWQLARAIFLPEMGQDIFEAFWTLDQAPRLALEALLKSQTSPFIEGRGVSRRAVCTAALDSAGAWLKNRMGAPDRWRMGNLYTLTLRHPLGTHPLLGPSFNLGPFPSAGSPTTLSAASHPRFKARWAVTARMIFDLANPDNSAVVLPAGQSGHPLDEHYRDQLPLYRDRLYHPCLMDTARIRRAGWDRLILNPEGLHE